MPAQLKSHTVGDTLVLTLSNPEFRNALGPEIYAAGTEALIAAESNPDLKTVVITGEGDHFCAGGNLNRLLENRQRQPQVQAQSIEGLHGWIQAIRFERPRSRPMRIPLITFWVPGASGSWGEYGPFGNVFGAETLSTPLGEFWISPIEYTRFKQARLQAALRASQLALARAWILGFVPAR